MIDRWMDGWTKGRTDGWTDGRTDGPTDWKTRRCMARLALEGVVAPHYHYITHTHTHTLKHAISSHKKKIVEKER